MNTLDEAIHLNGQNEIQEIIGNPPGWILRWGISVVAIGVGIFFVLAWMIKFPDILEAPVRITTENPAIRIVSKINGKIVKLFIEDQDTVKRGEILALMESDANWNDIIRLRKTILECEKTEDVLTLHIPKNLSVGPIQANYTQLVQQINDLQYLLDQTYDQLKLSSVSNQIDYFRKLNQGLEAQIKILSQEAGIMEDRYKRNQDLYNSGVISLQDLKDLEVRYLQYQRELESTKTQRVSNQVTIEKLRSEKAEIQRSRSDGLALRKLAIEELCRQIKSDIESWENTYLITSPIDGQIAMSKIWSRYQFIEANTDIFTIVPPEGTGSIIAKAWMPAMGIGKIRENMNAHIALDGYPQEEYGIIKATISEIGLIPEMQKLNNEPEELAYPLILILPKGLQSTYGKSLAFKQEMSGTAELITEERRIAQRIFNQFQNILQNN